jgi:hypothetical protein
MHVSWNDGHQRPALLFEGQSSDAPRDAGATTILVKTHASTVRNATRQIRARHIVMST